MTFRIRGDGQTLWTSQPLTDRGSSERFDIEVSGVDSLELSCSIDGASDWCHAVWIEPRLE